MSALQKLLDNNKAWAAAMLNADPGFFTTLARQQQPEYLWIGCSDSRVPASQILAMPPGQVFVHRNIANLIQIGDPNCLSVIQFAVEVLEIKHIIVCGHYGCGGIQAAIENSANGMLDDWIGNIKLTLKKHADLLCQVPKEKHIDVVCELNVNEQIMTLAHHRTIQDSWERGSEIAIHGWVYNIADGILKDLHINCGKDDTPLEIHQAAVEKITATYS